MPSPTKQPNTARNQTSNAQKEVAQLNARTRTIMRTIVWSSVIAVISLLWFQLINGPKLAHEAQLKRSATTTLLAHRGDIVDANNNVLATTVDEYMITVDQTQVAKFKPIDCDSKGENKSKCHQIDGHPVGAEGAVGIARIMASYLGRNSIELGYKLSGKLNYSMVAQNVKPQLERNLIQNGHINDYFTPIPVVNRAYPNENVAGEEIGTANTTIVDKQPVIQAKSGIELLMNKELGGKDGELKYERGAQGDVIPMAPIEETPAVNGHNVRVTIDIDVQWKLQQLLDDTQQKWGAAYGYGVVEEIKTGKILAIGSASEASAGSLKAAEKSRVINNSFEPGSTAKVFAAEELIESGLSDPEKHYFVTGKYRTRNGQDIEDAHEERPTTQWTLAGIIAQSWNTGTVAASEDMSDSQRVNMLKKFGLGKATTLGFPGEGTGVVHDQMDGRMRHTVLFGQGMSATALQMVNAYAAIANGGIDPQPKIIDAIQTDDDKWEPYSKPGLPEPAVMAKPDAAEKTMQILEVSVRDGIAKPAQIDRYRVGGKSGTAEMICDRELGSDLNCNMRNFISVLPMDNPRFAVGMFFYGKKGHEIWGSVVAIPPVTEMNQFLIQKYAIPPSTPAEWLPAVTW